MNIIRHVVEINGCEEIINVPFTDILSIELSRGSNFLAISFRYGATSKNNILIYYDYYKTLKELEKDLINHYIHLSPNNEVLGFESSDKIFEIREEKEYYSYGTSETNKTTKLTWEIKTNL